MIEVHQIPIQRRTIRKKRQRLSHFELKQAEIKVIAQLLKLPEMKYSKRIGVYLDAFGEVPTAKLITQLLKRGKAIYLPVICPMNNKLHWQKISFAQQRNQRYFLHRLGMKQAMNQRAKCIDILDTVLMPLVIFDQRGHRVGMGGGYYDRTLAHHTHRPIRIGLAHDFQYSEHLLATQHWDQALHLACTPSKVYRFY